MCASCARLVCICIPPPLSCEVAVITIRTLTPRIKREIQIFQNSGSYGTTRFREPDGRVRPIFVRDPREPNPIDPGTVVQDSLSRPRYFDGPSLGRRRYDATIDAWVKIDGPPALPAPVVPRPSPVVHGDTEGAFYWITCRETGHRMRRIRAQTPARAQAIAAQYALSNGLPASAAYARA